MKKIFFPLLLSCCIYAHHPEINYELIQEWCQTTGMLQQEEVNLLKNYLQDFKEFIQCSLSNPQCTQTEEGKKLQRQLDEDINEILKHPSLKLLYEKFTVLIKEEIGNYKESLEAEQRKKEYELLTDVITGCLDCITNKNGLCIE